MDLFTHPSRSQLVFEGRLTKTDGAAYANAYVVTLTNNNIMHLYNNITYKPSGQTIESITNPGQATTTLGLLKYPGDFAKAQGINQLWHKDTNATASTDNKGFKYRHLCIIQTPGENGTFSFSIPLSHIFGFCDDYKKIVYGSGIP